MTDLEPDVEALLVQRPAAASFECFLVLIDACYELVGLVRMHWKGFDGGQEAWGGDRRLSTPSGSGAGRSGTGRAVGTVTADLVFDCIDAQLDRHAAVPTLQLKLRISETTGEQVHAIALRCQIRTEPRAAATRRRRPTGLLSRSASRTAGATPSSRCSSPPCR